MSNQSKPQQTTQSLMTSLRKSLPDRATGIKDTTAGLVVAVSSVPDGMASSLLANAAPIFGLYASVFGPLIGGIFASTQRMMITTTSASALAASQVLIGLTGDTLNQSLFLLVVMTGLLLLVAGVLRLGVITRFVSHSVMVGFLTGVALLLVLGQLGDLVGYKPEASNKVAQAIEVLVHILQIDLPTTFIGILTIVLAVVLPKTPLRQLGQLVALIIATLLVLVFNMDSVAQVKDVAEIPRGIPLPHIPSLSVFTPELLTGAIAIAVITLVQGAGVSQSAPNLDGTPSDQNRDFTAQGLANIVGGFFRSIPTGGSVGQTALSVGAGARTRWTAITSGLWMLVIIVVFPGVVSEVPMTSLAALLILAGISAIDIKEALWIWRTGTPTRITIGFTFIATLFLPIQVAVGLGAILSAILYVSQMSSDVSIVELHELPDGTVEEKSPSERLADNAITSLEIYGSVAYAGARTLEKSLPSPRGVEKPVVILRLRGTTRIGATFVDVLTDYAKELEDAGGQLFLSGLNQHVFDQLQNTGKIKPEGSVHTYVASTIVGESSRKALADAHAWIGSQSPAAPNEKSNGHHKPKA